MKLLNVRLDPEDAAMVKTLRRRGIRVSTLVRSAIRAAYERERPLAGRDVDEILAQVYARHPDPPGLSPLPIDPRDRRALRNYVRRRLRGRGA